MEYKRVGKSGLNVSRVSLGSWLTYGDSLDEQNSKEIIYTAIDKGVISFDTANAYNCGAAEIVLGKALKDIPRPKIVVATKVFWPMGDGVNEKGLSRKSVIEQTHASLSRLQMDYVDILYLHRFDPYTPVTETLRAVDDLIREGSVLYFGVSEWTAEQIKDAVNIDDKHLWDRMIVSQPAYNLLHRKIEKEVLSVCDKYDIGQIVFSPLAQGMLTGKYKRGENPPSNSRAASAQGKSLCTNYLTDSNFDKVEKLEKLCSEAGISMVQLSLGWILKQSAITGLILGASKSSQVVENIKATEIKLPDDVLEEAGRICME